jgi:hypothetical protein
LRLKSEKSENRGEKKSEMKKRGKTLRGEKTKKGHPDG